MDLAGQVLEKPFELVEVAIRGGQELGRVELSLGEPAHVLELGGEPAAETLDPPPHLDRVAALEAGPDRVGIAEYPRRDRPAPVAQLERQVGGAVTRGEPILAGARIAAGEGPPGRQLGDRRPLGRAWRG